MSSLVGQMLGPYEIVDFLGEGGVAHVYRARRSNGNADVAIKVVKPDITNPDELASRLKHEALVGASLCHPHILNVISYGQNGSTIYVVMPLLTGGNLASFVRRKKLRLPEISQILDQVASALDYMHVQGIVHRDVKLENILLDDAGRPILSDFGLVKALTDTPKQVYRRFRDFKQLTRSGLVLGTPGYMSPEQCRSQAVDARSDVYSLGVVLFELLTGELPFEGSSSIEALYMHIAHEPPKVSGLKPDLPEAIDSVVHQALAKRPEDRFTTAGELATAFKSAITKHEGISVRAHARESKRRNQQTPYIKIPQVEAQTPAAGKLLLSLLGALLAVTCFTVSVAALLLTVHR